MRSFLHHLSFSHGSWSWQYCMWCCAEVALSACSDVELSWLKQLVLPLNLNLLLCGLVSPQVPLSEASSMCRHQWMRDALNSWIVAKGWETQLAAPAASAATATTAVAGAAASSLSDSGSFSSG